MSMNSTGTPLKNPSLFDLTRDWLKETHYSDDGWYVFPDKFFGKWALIYKDQNFSSIAVWLWDDKALNPRRHVTLPMEDMTTYDFHAADPDFFPKIRKAMDEIEEQWKPQSHS